MKHLTLISLLVAFVTFCSIPISQALAGRTVQDHPAVARRLAEAKAEKERLAALDAQVDLAKVLSPEEIAKQIDPARDLAELKAAVKAILQDLAKVLGSNTTNRTVAVSAQAAENGGAQSKSASTPGGGI